MANPSGGTARLNARDRMFLAALAADKSVVQAAKVASYSRSSVYRYRDSDAQFRAGWDAATDAAVERLEAQATERAASAQRKPRAYDRQGEQSLRLSHHNISE